MPTEGVRALTLDEEGALWIGTASGLYRFDGREFEPVAMAGIGSPDTGVLSLLSAPDGRLYVGTDGQGVRLLQHGVWRAPAKPPALLDGHVRALVLDRQNRLWMGTDYGVYRLADSTLIRLDRAQGLPDNLVTGLAMDVLGRVWASTLRGGLAFDAGETWQPARPIDGSEPGALFLTADSSGVLWAGGFDGLMMVPVGEEIPRPLNAAGESPVCDMAASSSSLWLARPGQGLVRLSKEGEGITEEILPAQGITVQTLAWDGWGGLWVGTASDGLYQIAPSSCQIIGLGQGLLDATVTALLPDGSGGMWIGTRNGGLVYRDPAGRVQAAMPRKGRWITALAQDGSGHLWVASADGGILRGPGGHWRTVMATGPDDRVVNALTPDGEGGLWMGTDQGLFRWTLALGVQTMFTGRAVRQLEVPEPGTLLAATSQGLWRLDTSGIHLVYPDSTLNCQSFIRDRVGRLWLACRDGDLHLVSGEPTAVFNQAHGLPGGHILGLTLDGQGRLWASTPQGLWAFDPDTVHAATPWVFPQLWDATDGLPGAPTGPVRLLSDGSLAVATDGGVALIPDQAGGALPPVAPRLQRLERGTSPRNVHVRVDAPHAAQGHRLRLLYRLQGSQLQNGLIQPGQARTLAFDSLPPGSYRLTVQTVSPEGQVSPPAHLAWRVARSSWIFWALGFVLALSGVGGLVLRRRKGRSTSQAPKYQTSTLRPDLAQAALGRLAQLMDEERIYLDPDLSLKALAQRCRVHPNHLSRIINEKFGMGYNDFINRRRIASAKALLDDPVSDRSIQEIMEVSGFYSKSVFNTAFKKWMGMTPSMYRSQTGSKS